MLQMHTLQQAKFVEAIKPGDRIDVRDCEGDWFEAVILSVTGKIAKCHFINYSSKWDCNIQLSSDNVAQRNAHSKSTGKPDNYKYLLECVHELLYIRKEDDDFERAAKEIGIGSDELQQFIQRGEPKNDAQKRRILQWIQTQSNLMGIDLKAMEVDDTDTDAMIAGNNDTANVNGNPTAVTLNSVPAGYSAINIHRNMHGVPGGIHLQQPLNRRIMNVQMNSAYNGLHGVYGANVVLSNNNNAASAIPAPPADILASCIATLPKIMLSNDHTPNASTNLAQSKKHKTDTNDTRNGATKNTDSGSLLVNPLHMISSADVSGSTVSSLSSSSSTLSSTSLATSLYSSPTNINISERAYLAGTKRMRPQQDDILPIAKKRKLIDIEKESDEEDSDYSSSSYESEDISDAMSLSESDGADDDEDIDSVMVPKTDGTKITFVKMSHKQFEREQKEFEKQAEIAKKEILQKEKKQAMQQEERKMQQRQRQKQEPRNHIMRMMPNADDNDESTSRQKRKYKTRAKMNINANEMDDFSEFKIVLSDANLNLNHSVYPGRKFRGIAKSGRRWRARTCVLGKTQYGEKSFYNPFLAAMEYDRLLRANRQPELSGAVKTKTQIILNFPYGLKQQTIRIHKLFEKELQQMDHDAIKKRFSQRFNKKEEHLSLDDSDGDEEYTRGKKRKRKKKKKKKRKTRKEKEEPIIDNKGLATKIPIEFLMKINSSLYQTERLKPFGPCRVEDDTVPIITHYSRRNNNVVCEEEDVAQNTEDWVDSGGCAATSLFFGYRTLHISSNK